MKGRVYRFLAIVFAIVGAAIFAVIFQMQAEGNIQKAVTDPIVVGMILLPFIPAALLSFISGRCNDKLRDLLDTTQKKD